MSTYVHEDAEPEIRAQQEVVEMAYDLRATSESAYREYQTELMKLDKMTGGAG